MKKTLAVLVVCTLAALLLPEQTLASDGCDSKKVVVAKATGGGAALGALIGAIGGRGKGAAIGAGIGAVAGAALGAAQRPCKPAPRYASHEQKIAPAWASSSAPGVLVKLRSSGSSRSNLNIFGSGRHNESALRPYLDQIPNQRGYTIVDDDYEGEISYWMEIIVEGAGDGGNSGSLGLNNIFRGVGTHSSGTNTWAAYTVSVRLIDVETGLPDPNRTATKTVSVVRYQNTNNNFYASRINGHSSGYVRAANPQMAATIIALKDFFSYAEPITKN